MADAFQPNAFQTSASGTPEAFQSGGTSPPPPPPPSKLFRPANYNGLGGGGPFFADPLAAFPEVR